MSVIASPEGSVESVTPASSRSAASPEAPAVELRQLSKSFGPVRAVDGVTLGLARGELLTILGPSGSGKTTTLRMIAGFTQPSSGAVLLDGKDITGLPAHRRDIGLVFQNYALFPHLTAGQNVAFPLQMRKVSASDVRRRVAEAFALVGLEGLEERFPRDLSGGQQQRVALARALVFRPRLLLMDEPLGALDRKLREGLQSEIRRLQQELAITVLYVTHDQDEALALSDRIALFRAGRIEQVGTGRDLYAQPASLFVAEFIGESNVIRGRVERRGQTLILSGRSASLRLPEGPSRGGGVGPGDAAVAVIRPEDVHVVSPPIESAPATGTRVAAEARIRSITYLGSSHRYELELPDGWTVIARQPAGQRPAAALAGGSVIVSWDLEDCMVFPDDSEIDRSGEDA